MWHGPETSVKTCRQLGLLALQSPGKELPLQQRKQRDTQHNREAKEPRVTFFCSCGTSCHAWYKRALQTRSLGMSEPDFKFFLLLSNTG